ncbi:MAG: hypothetical protein J6P43_08235, partial [Succinivibrionaceae bacterium]|nr:hypothetical protein [Succinivibrionaceae bacterium]
MQIKKLALSVAAVSALGVFSSANAYTTHEEQIIVHPFQWTYDMIADECEEVLGPKGFDGVQISQPAEHIDRRDVWWAVYQPVNFNNFTTMTGNEQQLRNMIKRCNAAGVRVYADAVFNQRGNAGNRGFGGSYYDARSFNYPDLDRSDFNDYNCSPNYGDKWSVWHCALSGMPDLNVENEATQQKVANYLKNLMSMGVYGFRIDAAKHMQPGGIAGILAKAGNPLAYMEVIGANGEAVQPGDYTSIPNSVVTEFRYCPTMQNNINNPKVLLDMNDSWFNVGSDGAETFIVNHDNERGSAGTSYLNYKNSPRYSIAQSFLVAWPYGKIRQVYTGYKFSEHDPAGPFGDARCTGGWNCEHRVSVVMNAVGFARATRGYGVSYKGASDDGKVIWFTRGDKGFYVMNSSDQPIKWTFDTHMPDGEYTEILQQPDPSAGQKITVKNGKAEIMVYDKSAAAICIDDSGRGFCGGPGPEPCVGNSCPPVPSADLYFAGTTNNWKFDKFDYDAEKRVYTLNLQLTGAGDANGPQRFKLTTAADWKHTIYGDATDNKICSDEVKCPDIVIPEQGSYVLTVSLDDKSWKLVGGDVPGCNPSVDALYFAGTTNSWTHEQMSFDTESCKWKVDLNLTGDGDNNGSQRFKVTTAPNWNGKVYGTAGGNKLCSNQANCGDVYITEKGQYTLSVDDKEFTWELTKNGNENYIPATRDAMYFAGTTNKWKHTAMKYNSSTGDWEIALNLTGAGDNGGAQRFKVTSAANW